MIRTTAEANDGNRYTEGNPSLGIPATVIGALEMNNLQEEIVNVVLDQNITLDGAIENQLLLALRLMIQAGGSLFANFTIANNQVSQSVTVLAPINKLLYKGAHVKFDLFRRTDTQNKNETGTLFISHNTETDAWAVFMSSHGDDAEVTFGITAAGQLTYTSNDLTGASYSGVLRLNDLKTFELPEI